MILLRELADAGRTVVVVTHSVENLGLADYLLVLAAGGHVAYFGPPGDAPEYFGVPEMPSVFLALEAAPGAEWTRRWRESAPERWNLHDGRTRPPLPQADRQQQRTCRYLAPAGLWSRSRP